MYTETQNGNFKLLLLVLALLASFQFVSPLIAHAETVASDNFVLRDSAGRMTAQLTTSKEGTPAFFMYDTKGVPRISIGLYQDGAPGVVLNDDQGLAGALMRLEQSNGRPVVVLKQNGRDRFVIDPTGSASMPLSGSSPWYAIYAAIIAATLASFFTYHITKIRNK